MPGPLRPIPAAPGALAAGRLAAVICLAVAFAAAASAVAVDVDTPTTYASTSPSMLAATLLAGWALLLAGSLAWWDRPTSWTGPVTTALGVAWLAPVLVGWDGGPAALRSLAMLAAPFLPTLLLHLALGLPNGRLPTRTARRTATAAYTVTAVYVLLRATVRDPLLDLYCWSNCTDNVLLVVAEPRLARMLDDGWDGLGLGISLLAAGVASVRLAKSSPVGHRIALPVAAPTVVAAAAETSYAGLLLLQPREDPTQPAFAVLFLVRAATYAALAAGVGWGVGRSRRSRQGLARLAEDLTDPAGSRPLRDRLAAATGDPGLRVLYRLPDSDRYVDADGHSATAGDDDARATTSLVRRGETVALVVHDPHLAVTESLAAEIGEAARLAVDNERLRAGLLAQLEDLRASRARIVEEIDTSRRRLERDLHDGAQQRMLALTYELRLARASAEHRDQEVAPVLALACQEAQAAVEELRDLAHGIYPAILTEAGLGSALWSLADTAPLPTEVADVPDARLPERVERAAYVVVAESVRGAARGGADHIEVSARVREGVLVVTVRPVQAAEPDQHLEDRVGALGGKIQVESGTLRAEVPCA